MNLPNKLTIFRIILVPIMVIIPFLGIQGNLWNIPIPNLIIIAIFAVASYTDHLDGKIARKHNLVTTFGKFADPLADKILVLSAMLMLVEMSKIPAWIPIIVLTREFVVSGYRLIAVEKGGKVIAANIWGKIKTVTQMIAIILTFIDLHTFFGFVSEGLTGYELAINILASSFMVISTIAAVFSGVNYLKGCKELFE
jgi:CDP-diacylglycerol--glycerol-3-phosphate 3-phosphatidyltransferase